MSGDDDWGSEADRADEEDDRPVFWNGHFYEEEQDPEGRIIRRRIVKRAKNAPRQLGLNDIRDLL